MLAIKLLYTLKMSLASSESSIVLLRLLSLDIGSSILSTKPLKFNQIVSHSSHRTTVLHKKIIACMSFLVYTRSLGMQPQSSQIISLRIRIEWLHVHNVILETRNICHTHAKALLSGETLSLCVGAVSYLTHATDPENGALFLFTGGFCMLRLKMSLTSFRSAPKDLISSKCFWLRLEAMGSRSNKPSKLSRSLKVAVMVVQSSNAWSPKQCQLSDFQYQFQRVGSRVVQGHQINSKCADGDLEPFCQM